MPRILSPALLTLVLIVAGCAKPPPAPSQGAATTRPVPPAAGSPAAGTGDDRLPRTGALRVWAHETLRPVVPELIDLYRQRNPDVAIEPAYGAHADLRKALADGGVHVILGFLAFPEGTAAHVVAGNQLVIVTNREHPTLLSVPEDLLKEHIPAVGIAPVDEPAGSDARAFLAEKALQDAIAAKLKQYPTSAGILEAVAAGQLPLGFAYATEAQANPAVKTTLACGLDASPTYAAVKRGKDPLAADFVEFLAQPGAQQVFRKAGYAPVEPHPVGGPGTALQETGDTTNAGG
ncbi:MAG TPA: substrate-binding domain-containing protein [bacterium]|nr:substrate-binding domain-containing protein [bacterium]